MKHISLLGSTGSIGKQTLEVVAANPDKLKVRALAAHRSDELLEQQIRQFEPDIAVLSDKDAAARLAARYHGKTKILAGDEGLLAAATYDGADTVLASMVGYAGLRPTLAAIECGKNIALANKETLVAAGSLVMAAVRKHGVSLTPVDSEHSAIFQSLRGGAEKEVKRLIVTASGGPFRGKKRSEMENVTLAQCLKHPNWSMGPKVTLDSSTLANKGLEVMEAHWLFDMPYDKIDVVVHPQSIVHSLVEFCDGSVIAQLGEPDMRLPIQYALSWPDRFDYSFEQLDLVKAASLTFEAPDLEAFPSLKIAVDCGKAGGTLPCAFNAANEEAVNAFLHDKIKYLDIPYITAAVTQAHDNVAEPQIEDIEQADAWARAEAQRVIEGLQNRP
ncbi:1-deoxy-D-xylulose-5-phosphate reductoisomerase [uncultured Phascolarctobacterium sp.]|jgi:1-deoxy-D-xylulose-5-phosphate reductoisomerase|uniref:1-deoxy-D-xylulose-5-phosphate reductoisomerase n=1 Tax=uncultured Phascolarctobacterium sp. TaxID=512296 RepID=UPI0025D0BC6C|nr:1-deoxy-D-xylulose-5-phosphate reductoisomerase [uncultured Phascolarctobacterium sp.]